MDHMIAGIRFDEPAVVPDIRYGAFSLLAGCRTEEGPVGSHIFFRVDIKARNLDGTENLFMRVSMIPAQIIESFTIGKIISLGKRF